MATAIAAIEPANTTVAQFCAQEEGVSQPSYYHWRRKLRGPAEPAKPKAAQDTARFIPVALNRNAQIDIPKREPSARLTHACTTIELPGGVRITVQVPATGPSPNDVRNTASTEKSS